MMIFAKHMQLLWSGWLVLVMLTTILHHFLASMTKNDFRINLTLLSETKSPADPKY